MAEKVSAGNFGLRLMDGVRSQFLGDIWLELVSYPVLGCFGLAVGLYLRRSLEQSCPGGLGYIGLAVRLTLNSHVKIYGQCAVLLN